MKIIIGMTISKNEGFNSLLYNLQKTSESKFGIEYIINTNKSTKELSEHKNIAFINEVSDMRGSRISLLNEMYKFDADMYIAIDSDIEFTETSIDDYIKNVDAYRSQYDFISMYYIGDSPLPAFYTLSSSLNDFYNDKIGKSESNKEVFFDDSDYNNSTYYYPCDLEGTNIENVLYGKQYKRIIKPFTNNTNELDNVTGGATIYFNKEILKKNFEWKENDQGKSLTWYDSYRTFKLNKKYGGEYNFAKVPVFVNHNRHKTSISLNWKSVINYIDGYNLYKWEECSEEPDKMILHTLELIMYSKGMIKKIKLLNNLSEKEQSIIVKIEGFLGNSKEFENYYKETKWK